MMGLFRRRSRFARLLQERGLGFCSMSGPDLWVGLPHDPRYGRVAVNTVPEAPKSVLFVEGPEQAALIAALAAGPEAATVENLMIGTSQDYIRADRRPPYDFAGSINALRGARLTGLRRLIVGDMELLSNSSGYYGRLGDIGPLFDMAPALVEIRICGRAELARPVRHERLETLVLTADDVAGHCGPMSQETLDSLLSSDFPRLKTLDLSLQSDAAAAYRIPEAFFARTGYPALTDLSIDCLRPEDEERLGASRP